MNSSGKSLHIAWGLAIVLGCILLVAGLLKISEPLQFVKQIADYKILPWPTSHLLVAWTMLIVECALGAALIVGYRMRVTLIFSSLLFLAFLGAVGWAWMTGATADCGCFGSWAKRTPGEAFAEDLLMLGGSIAAFWLVRKQPVSQHSGMWRVAVISAFAAIGLVLPLNFGILSTPAVEAQKAEQSIADLKITGLSVNLKQGTHVVAFMLTECEHCQASVPTFNSYLTTKNVPNFVALCPDEDWKRQFFAQRYGAKFPLGQISNDDFNRILGPTGDTPHIVLLRNGKIVKTWDVNAPKVEELQAMNK